MLILIQTLEFIGTILFIFAVSVFPFQHYYAWRYLLGDKVFYYLNLTRLFNVWNLFNNNGILYNTLIITAITNKKTYQWDLRFSKKIGNIYIYSAATRVTLAHYYSKSGRYYFNDYFFENIKKYLKDQGEDLKYFSLRDYNINIYSKSIVDKKLQDEMPPIFEWRKEDEKSN